MVTMYPCPFCEAFLKTEKTLLLHVKREHGTPRKTCFCRIEHCDRSYDDLYSYKKHVKKVHLSTANTRSHRDLKQSCDSSEGLSPELEQFEVDPGCKRMKFSDLNTKPDNDYNAQCMLVGGLHTEISNAAYAFEAFQADVVVGHDDCNTDYKIPAVLDSQDNDNELRNPFYHCESVDTSLCDFQKEQSLKAAKLVTSLYANCNLPRFTAHEIVASVQEFFESSVDSLKQKYMSVGCASENNMEHMFDIVKDSFTEFQSEHVTMKKLESGGYFIPPLSIPIKGTLRPRRNKNQKTLVTVNSTIDFIPFEPVLKRYLESPNVFSTIIQFIKSNQNKTQVSSMLEGETWQSILQYFRGKLVRPITLFFDDYEINNPLGSHRGKAKIGGVYYTLSCIPQQFASKKKIFF